MKVGNLVKMVPAVEYGEALGIGIVVKVGTEFDRSFVRWPSMPHVFDSYPHTWLEVISESR